MHKVSRGEPSEASTGTQGEVEAAAVVCRETVCGFPYRNVFDLKLARLPVIGDREGSERKEPGIYAQ